MTSPILVGRAAELDALRSAALATRDRQSRIVLIGGDAGIGKTRLVSEFCARARDDGMLAAVGGCVQLGDVAIAYAPLVEALREVSRQLGADAFAELVGPGRAELDGLIGGRGAAVATSPGPLFEHLLGLLTRLGERRPTALVLEDMHWADASTLALMAFLGRNLRDARVVLVLTYRVDELHRRHPLRPLLTDLERDPSVERLRLAGLSRAELIELLTGIGEAAPGEPTVDDLLARTEGNPFYVEELVAAGSPAGMLPDTLAEVVLTRVGRLSESTQSLLHRAAVLGDEVDERLLAAVAGQSADVVTSALREALFEQLLVVDAAGCRFRHALIREVLYDDLLPGERERLHVAAAHAVEDPALANRLDEHVRWAMLAHHWHAARESGRAFAASIRAGEEAEKVRALADAAAHYERALQLWDQTPDAAAVAAMSRAELFERAARSVHWSSHSSRAITLAKAALDALEPDATPETRAVQLIRLGRMYWTQYHGPEAVTAYDRAVALLADRPASWEQAYTLAALGQSLMLRGLARQAESTLNSAISVASSVDDSAVAGHAMCSLGPALAELGRVDEAIATMHRALELCRAHGNAADVCRCYTNLTHVLLRAGRYDELERVGAEGMAYAEESGHLRHYGESIFGNRLAALTSSGQWHTADAVAGAFLERVPAEDPYLILRWLPLLVGQGRLERVRELVDFAVTATADADDVQFQAVAKVRAALLAWAEHRWDDARALVASGIAGITPDEQYYGIAAHALALRIEADRISSERVPAAVDEARAVSSSLIASARAFASGLTSSGVELLPEPAAALATAEAEHARAMGTDDAELWAAVAKDWERVGQPYQVAMARFREADALLRARGDRVLAAAAAGVALSVAEELGAEPLAGQVRLLIQRGRLELPTSVPAERDPLAELGVTAREADVLALLATGMTNRQIGESLFISEKTASVHVTNLLRKLSVSNRVEAAAIAQNLGLA
jgi:DNA-binding CsgD family transcriptional regulator